MCEHHGHVLLNYWVLIRKALIQLVAVLVDNHVERDGDIAKCDDDVASNIGILRCLEDLKKQAMVLIAEGRTKAEELAERNNGSCVQNAILGYENK